MSGEPGADVSMKSEARVPKLLWVFCAVTLAIWVGRVRNVFADETLVGADRVQALVLPVLFVLFALVVLAVALTPKLSFALPQVMLAVAVASTAIWVVRSIMISFGDHEAAFVVVHLVLAIVSIALAWSAASALGLRVNKKVEVPNGVGSGRSS